MLTEKSFLLPQEYEVFISGVCPEKGLRKGLHLSSQDLCFTQLSFDMCLIHYFTAEDIYSEKENNLSDGDCRL